MNIQQARKWWRVAITLMMVAGASGLASGQVRIDTGLVEGTENPVSKVRSFEGIPFAAPPVGSALEGARARCKLDGGPRGHSIRCALHAGPDLP